MKASKTQAVHVKCKHRVVEKKKVERKQQEEPEPEKNKTTTDNNSAQSTPDGLPQSKPILIDYNTPKPKCRKIEG